MHSTDFILLLYSVEHMVYDKNDNERKKHLPPFHGILFQVNSKGSLICAILHTHTHSRARAHTHTHTHTIVHTICVTFLNNRKMQVIGKTAMYCTL